MSSSEFNADKITKCALIDCPAGDKILGGDLFFPWHFEGTDPLSFGLQSDN